VVGFAYPQMGSDRPVDDILDARFVAESFPMPDFIPAVPMGRWVFRPKSLPTYMGWGTQSYFPLMSRARHWCSKRPSAGRTDSFDGPANACEIGPGVWSKPGGKCQNKLHSVAFNAESYRANRLARRGRVPGANTRKEKSSVTMTAKRYREIACANQEKPGHQRRQFGPRWAGFAAWE